MSQMEEDILKVIYTYSINQKLPDKQFIEQLVEIILKDRSLKEYIKELVFMPNPKEKLNFTATMGYGAITKKIYIYQENLYIVLKKEMKELNLNKIEAMFYANFRTAQMLLHEIEHAIQEKQMDKLPFNIKKYDIETQLFRIYKYDAEETKKLMNFLTTSKNPVYQKKLAEKRTLYKTFYAYDPLERLAQLHSLTMVKKMITPLQRQLPNLYKIEMYNLFEESLNGYEPTFFEIKSPTLEHLKGLQYLEKLKDLEIYSNNNKTLISNILNQYSLQTRLDLGLPLTKIEYHELKRTLNSIKILN